MNKSILYPHGLDQNKWWILGALCILPLTIVIAETIRSHQLRGYFNFWRDFKMIRKRRKESIPTAEKTPPPNQTLIGFSHQKPVYIPDQCKHCFICGTTGSGKTVALSNFIRHGIQGDYPLLLVDGKGDIGNGSILEISKQFCREHKRKLYVINLSDPAHSDPYNPFSHALSLIHI